MALNIRTIGLGLASVTLLQACATKGYVNRTVDASAATQTAALATERSERTAADDAIRGDIAALRTELQSMRTEFSAQITALEDGLRFAFPVNFGFNEATVRQQDIAALERFASVAQRYYPGATITVEGFADPAGSAAYNRQLSERRAESVRSFLVSKGLSDMNIKAIGYGENRQVNPGAWGEDAGAEANRRVVFVVESVGATNVAVLPQQD